MNIIFALALAFTVVTPVFAGDITGIFKDYDSGELADAQWSFRAVDTGSGKEIAAHNARKNLCPASGTKLFTTAAALNSLGPKHRFKTVLFRSGRIDGGTLSGDIFIKGGGDPALGSDRANGSAPLEELLASWVQAVKKAGISKITGQIKADESMFSGDPIPAKWFWEDTGNYYGAQPSALSIADNTYTLYFESGKKQGSPVRLTGVKPEIKGLELENRLTAGSEEDGDNAYIYNGPLSYRGYISGTIPAGRKKFPLKGAVPDPALLTAQLLEEALVRNGIAVAGAAKTSERPDYSAMAQITETVSPPLSEIVKVTNKTSFNLYAEILLRHLARDGGITEGLDKVKDFLKEEGVPVNGFALYDGSGLSRASMVSAETITAMLSALAKKDYFPYFLDSLPVTGTKGDKLRNFCAGTRLDTCVFIKSGSMPKVRSYSGYIKNPDGRRIAFSFIVNNYSLPPDRIPALLERLLLAL
ncbi:MAG: D-alanyl-D-alanine carboxypeptidase/D-alanyl-D-alanine-endopeptidase [Elusimicrobiaceae bacterium]